MTETLGDRVIRWAHDEPSIELLVLIGSRARSGGSPGAADLHSDWDFQIAVQEMTVFADSSWTAALGVNPLAYVSRLGRLGSSQKVTALFADGELDLVVLPLAALRGLSQAINRGQQVENVAAKQALTDQASVLQGGYRILKGAKDFALFYEFVAREIPPARLSSEAIRLLGEEFVCDYVSTHRKIERGELIAAQRWLHHQLVEKNFQLLHELRLREGGPTFPDARRIEFLGDSRAAQVAVTAVLSGESLREAVEKAAETCRQLVHALIGDRWLWPDLSPLRLRAK